METLSEVSLSNITRPCSDVFTSSFSHFHVFRFSSEILKGSKI